MRIDLLPSDTWYQAGEGLHRHLKYSEETDLRVYQGRAAAVFEIVFGAALFYSHKKNLGLVKVSSPAFLGVMPHLYKEGFQVHSLSSAELSAPQAWMEKLPRDTGFILLAEDHPVTGELYSWQELDRLLNERKIFSIRMSHFSHWQEVLEPSPYSVRICSVTPDLAYAALGSKFKVPALMAKDQLWVAVNVEKRYVEQRNMHRQDMELVKKFESHLPPSFHPVVPHSQRLYDRAVVASREIHAENLLQTLSHDLKHVLAPPGWETSLETTNLCRWGGTRLYEEWWDPCPEADVLRGLVVISARAIEIPGFSGIFKKAVMKCQSSCELA